MEIGSPNEQDLDNHCRGGSPFPRLTREKKGKRKWCRHFTRVGRSGRRGVIAGGEAGVRKSHSCRGPLREKTIHRGGQWFDVVGERPTKKGDQVGFCWVLGNQRRWVV